MAEKSVDDIIKLLISLTRQVSMGNYDQSDEIFEYTKEGRYPESITELTESFSMMMVKVETREYQLEQMIEDLNRKNEELEATLNKVRLLENAKTHLSKFVPESVKRIIEETPDAPDLEKYARDVSVLFLDIAGYTKMSEKVESERMNYLLERYFSSFIDHIYKNNGDINETAGDGLMIIFQDETAAKHAENAVRTAVAIQGTVESINKDLAGRFEPVAVNIGINSGEASVGSSRYEGISGTRWTFTASGPVTNVAARIGALAKNGEILIGDETAERVGDRFPLEAIGEQTFKNVSKAMMVYKVQRT